MTPFLLYILLWALCGVAAAGLIFAYFQGRFEKTADQYLALDREFALLFGLSAGPLALVIAILGTEFGRYGWRLR